MLCVISMRTSVASRSRLDMRADRADVTSMRAALLALLLAGSLASCAHADASRTGPPSASWRDRFERGSDAYEEGRLQDALRDFAGSVLDGAPATVRYDIALTLDRLGQVPQAMAAYRSYLAAMPDAPNRAAVESRLAELAAPSTARSSGRILPLLTPDATAAR
jgi:hypothetical protein